MIRRIALVLVLAIGALIAGAGPAGAHDVLESSNPVDGSTLDTPPREVSMTFTGPPQNEFTTITLTGPDGQKYDVGDVVASDTTLTVPIGPLGPAGEYTVGFRILSSDSHPVSGAVRFRLSAPDPAAATTAPTTSTPVGTTAAAPESASSDDGDDDGTPVWPWILGAAVLLGAGVVFALRFGRAR